MNKKYNQEKAIEIMQSYGYKLDDIYKSYNHKLRIVDNDGYVYYRSLGDILSNKTPTKFGRGNPFTIENIKNYTYQNKIQTQLLSESFTESSGLLLWKCSCGKSYTCSWNAFENDKHLCNDCSIKDRGLKQRINKANVIDKVKSMGYHIVEIADDICVFDSIKISDDLGYKYYPVINNIIYDKRPFRFHKSNIFSIDNVNNYFRLIGETDYTCVSDEYIDNTSDLEILHKKCGTVFNAKLTKLTDKGISYCNMCPKCKTTKTESVHASVLKQVFLNKHPDSVLEDKSCINSKTGYSLPTDIVNHRLKLAIEIQSSLHDNRKDIDLYKKNFWIDRGYDFYSPDIRDYSILGMIQLFFKDIESIPKYIDYNFSNCVDFIEIQNMIDSGHTIIEIASIKNISEATIRGLVTDKKVILPPDYKNKIFKIKPILRLDVKGNVIKRYESLSSISRDGFATGTIRRVLKGKQKLSYGTKWIYDIKK